MGEVKHYSLVKKMKWEIKVINWRYVHTVQNDLTC